MVLRVCLTVRLRLTCSSANVAVLFSVDDVFVNRFLTEVRSPCFCALLLFAGARGSRRHRGVGWLPLHLLVCVYSWFQCFFLLVFKHFLYCRWKSKSLSCTSDVPCCRFWFLRCFENCSMVLTSCARRFVVRIARAYTAPSLFLARCSFVSLFLPSHTADFHELASLCACRISRSFSHLQELSKHGFTKFQHPSTVRPHPSHGRARTVHRALETRIEAGCATNTPCHQCGVGGRSALRAVAHCCQHCARLSQQLLVIVFHCSVDLVHWM